MVSGDTPEMTADLIWRVLDDGTVVISPDDGKVRVFNQCGSFVWSLVDGQNDIGDIADRLSEKYDISRDQALADIVNFLDELRDKGLIRLS